MQTDSIPATATNCRNSSSQSEVLYEASWSEWSCIARDTLNILSVRYVTVLRSCSNPLSVLWIIRGKLSSIGPDSVVTLWFLPVPSFYYIYAIGKYYRSSSVANNIEQGTIAAAAIMVVSIYYAGHAEESTIETKGVRYLIIEIMVGINESSWCNEYFSNINIMHNPLKK